MSNKHAEIETNTTSWPYNELHDYKPLNETTIYSYLLLGFFCVFSSFSERVFPVLDALGFLVHALQIRDLDQDL